jgi:hypothetical protein
MSTHFNDNGYLKVLFEDFFAQLIPHLKRGKGLITHDELFCTLETLDDQLAPDPLPIRPLLPLPQPDQT